MSVSEAGGHVFDQIEENDIYIPGAVVNRLSGAKLPSEYAETVANTDSFNSPANTGCSSSQPLPSAATNHIYGVNDSLIHAVRAYTPTGLTFRLPGPDVLQYPHVHLNARASNSFVTPIQDRLQGLTSQHLASALAPSTRDEPQFCIDSSFNTLPSLPIPSSFKDSLYSATSGSTSQAQPLDLENVNEETWQAASLYDAPVQFSRPSGSGFEHIRDSSDMWGATWFPQDSNSPGPQLENTLLPRPTLASGPFPQENLSEDLQMFKSFFNVDSPSSTYLDASFPVLQPLVSNSHYSKEGAVLPNRSPITSPDCVCNEGEWLPQCPRLWDHYQSAPASTSAVCKCTKGTPNQVVLGDCPAAAAHLWAMVLNKDRAFADRYQNATQRNHEDNTSPYVPSALVNPPFSTLSGSIANHYAEPRNHSPASTEVQKYPSSVPQSSPAPESPVNPPIQHNNHARFAPPTPPVSTTRGPSFMFNASTALSPPQTQFTSPILGNRLSLGRPCKRSISDDPGVSNTTKKQKTDPSLESFEDLFYHKSGPMLQIRQRSAWLGMPSRGDQKRKRGKKKKQAKGKRKGGKERKGKGVSKNQPMEIIERTPYMDEDDRAYLDEALEKIRSAPFRQEPQQIESIVGKDGACKLDVVRHPRSTGIGQVWEGDSVYFIFLSQVEDDFLCWICGHKMTVEKQLRALGHVRTHFEHRPYPCNYPCRCLKSWATEEAMNDEHQKKSKIYGCRHCLTPTTFPTPSNRARHIREMHPNVVKGSEK